ncbi:hypothetical protein TNCV_4427481 [Trichonephila clavipes]|nr:hypothetical protein TNCV_4427481 [Trichonephila clavipes]
MKKNSNQSIKKKAGNSFQGRKVNLLENSMVPTHQDPLEQYLDSHVPELKEEIPSSVTDDPEQEESFETLKIHLMTSPVPKQADESKPFTIRTDTSNYALGAVFLQGSIPMNMSSNMQVVCCSTSKWKDLAVMWTLEKFRSCAENQ